MVNTTLIKRCQAREDAAFEELYTTYSTKALRTACLLIGRREIAEEAMQDAFFQCYQDITKLRDPELFNVWFHRILVRTCRDVSVKEKKLKLENLDETYIETLHDDCDVATSIEQKQESILLLNTINKLSESLRTTIILFYYNDMSIKEIASIMNCFEGTVKSRLYYAKKTLGKKLRGLYKGNSIMDAPLLRKEG